MGLSLHHPRNDCTGSRGGSGWPKPQQAPRVYVGGWVTINDIHRVMDVYSPNLVIIGFDPSVPSPYNHQITLKTCFKTPIFYLPSFALRLAGEVSINYSKSVCPFDCSWLLLHQLLLCSPHVAPTGWMRLKRIETKQGLRCGNHNNPWPMKT